MDKQTFKHLYDFGIVGRTWRILYNAYVGFKCRVRIHTKVSKWYDMSYGIHQGGFLSLIKYVAFVNSLLVEIENSNLLCVNLRTVKCSPVGYADDLSTACNTQHKLDRVMVLVSNHRNKWRYEYNAQKGAVLIHGEDLKTHYVNKKHCEFALGNKKIPEKEN